MGGEFYFEKPCQAVHYCALGHHEDWCSIICSKIWIWVYMYRVEWVNINIGVVYIVLYILCFMYNLTPLKLNLEQLRKGWWRSNQTQHLHCILHFPLCKWWKTGGVQCHINSFQSTMNILFRLQIIPAIGIILGAVPDKCMSSASRDRFRSGRAVCSQNAACAWINSSC